MIDKNDRKDALRRRHAELLVAEGHQPNVEEAIEALDAIDDLVDLAMQAWSATGADATLTTLAAIYFGESIRPMLLPDAVIDGVNVNSLVECVARIGRETAAEIHEWSRERAS